MGLFSDLENVVWDFAIPGGVDVLRRTLTARDERGEESPAATQTLLIDPIIVRALVGAELDKLVEGDRDREHIELQSIQRLHTARAGTNEGTDIVLYDPNGEGNKSRYRVLSSENHVRNSGNWRSIAVKEESP